MRDRLTRFGVLLGILSLFGVQAMAQDTRRPIVGDFAAELRRPDGHMDVDANIRALRAMGANTYFYLIWHKPTDWDDLPEFASAAERAGIDVWVYLIPWSETPLAKKSWGYSEPYRTDYVRWAEEVGRLSVGHRNIVGYVIDDFYTNSTQPDRFTVPYVRKMVDAGRRENPRLKFYPLVYFGQPWADFTARYGELIDGVVAAYPKSRLQVGNALAYLNDDAHGASVIVNFPRSTPSRAGDTGAVRADLRVRDAAHASISFYWDEGDQSEHRGYHQAFVSVDGRTVWKTDTAGGGGDHVIHVDLSKAVKGKDKVRIELGVVEKQGVTRYPLQARFDDIRWTGFDADEMASERLFRTRVVGEFGVDLLPAGAGRGGFRIPMILMPAGDPEQHEKRYPEPGSPKNIAKKVALSMDMAREGRVEGVVTYCTPKGSNDPVFQAVAREFRGAAAAPTRREPAR